MSHDLQSRSAIPPHKSALLSACISANVLTFGSFELKSKRISPYFFNAGLLHTATLLETLGEAYAQTITSHASRIPEFDIVFGPSYKGIPLCIEALGALRRLDAAKYGGKSYAFNRKEKKDHGEGGGIVGASLKGKNVLVVDDVATAGTALREAVGIIEAEGGKVVGVVVALDRMERMVTEAERSGKRDEQEEATGMSALGELRRALGIPVVAVLTLDDLIGFAGGQRSEDEMKQLQEYRKRYIARG